jgi:hypothetical protein
MATSYNGAQGREPGEHRVARATASPRRLLSITDAVALIVGGVLGAGIFKTPTLVAANAGSDGRFLLAWTLGGIASWVGAFCYAELATAYPHAGGDYQFLRRAFGRDIAFLFAWARMTVMQTGVYRHVGLRVRQLRLTASTPRLRWCLSVCGVGGSWVDAAEHPRHSPGHTDTEAVDRGESRQCLVGGDRRPRRGPSGRRRDLNRLPPRPPLAWR